MAKWNLEPATLVDAGTTDEIRSIIKRLKRKADVMRLDQKAQGSVRYHDSSEILTLLDMLERKLGIKDD
jgi:hypothetical protein